jgi:hypothetical protein
MLTYIGRFTDMPALINLSNDDKKPLLINPSEIAGLQFYKGDDGKTKVSLYNNQGYNDKEERHFQANLDEWNLSRENIVKKLREAGVPLVHFPLRHSDLGGVDETDRYLNPAAVAYATVSKPETGYVETEIGVKGVGRQQSSLNTPKEWAEMLKAIRAVKPLMEYKSDEAYFQFSSNAAGLYIDPKLVKRVSENGHIIDMMRVLFDQTGSIDVQIVKSGLNEKRVDEAFNNNAQHVMDDAGRVARFKFADELATANGNLTPIPSDKFATYIRPEDIKDAYLSDYNGTKNLVIEFQKSADERFGDTVNIAYDTEKDAQKALATLTATKNKPPQAAPSFVRGPAA